MSRSTHVVPIPILFLRLSQTRMWHLHRFLKAEFAAIDNSSVKTFNLGGKWTRRTSSRGLHKMGPAQFDSLVFFDIKIEGPSWSNSAALNSRFLAVGSLCTVPNISTFLATRYYDKTMERQYVSKNKPFSSRQSFQVEFYFSTIFIEHVLIFTFNCVTSVSVF